MRKLLHWLNTGLVLLVINWLASPALHAQVSTTTLEGILQIVWSDPHPKEGAGGTIRYTLTQTNGVSVGLDMAGKESIAASYFGKSVIVTGRPAAGPPQQATSPNSVGLLVDTLSLSGASGSRAPQASVFGTNKVIYLLVKFSDDSAVPHPPSFYTNLNNPDTPPGGELFPATVNGFFHKTSWGQFGWTGDVGGVGGLGAPGGWLTLPQPKSYYANCGWNGACSNLQQLGIDATALGRVQGIDFRNYDNINFVLSNDLDCCASGGTFYSAVDAQVYGATWEPPWGQEAGTYAHEMGHSLGLPHSGWVYEAYDSPWDIMSDRTNALETVCGSYFSRNSNATRNLYCSEPGDGYIAAHKDYLGWIPLANTVQTTMPSAVTVTLEGSALPLGASAKIAKICLPGFSCTGSSARYFTVEARVGALGATSQYDNGLAGEGIIIHEVQRDRPAISGPCFFNNQSGWAVPVDATPNDYNSAGCNSGGRSFPNYGLNNAQWTVGQTYTNSTYGFRVSVQSRSGSSFVVGIATTQVTPPTPPSISSVIIGSTQLTFLLSPPSNNGGAAITSYSVTCTASGEATAIGTSATTTVVVSDLKPGVIYNCTAKASNGIFVSTSSSALTTATSASIDLSPILMLLLL